MAIGKSTKRSAPPSIHAIQKGGVAGASVGLGRSHISSDGVEAKYSVSFVGPNGEIETVQVADFQHLLIASPPSQAIEGYVNLGVPKAPAHVSALDRAFLKVKAEIEQSGAVVHDLQSATSKDVTEQQEAVVLQRATEVIGDRPDAMRWLGTPVRALGYATPISLLHDAKGREEVLIVLGRLEHGVL